MTTFDLRRLRLHSGEQYRGEVEVAIEPLVLGGQEYAVEPSPTPAELVVTQVTSGAVFELSFGVTLRGPCQRCLADATLDQRIHAREYQAARPGGDDELRTPYLVDDVLDLSSLARDALALELPDKILCRPDCAGLCPVCGRDLNVEPHTHEELAADPRWSALDELRGQL
jgi:DUF177 domain-containing protein